MTEGRETQFGITVHSYRKSAEHIDEWVFVLRLHGRIDQQNSTELSGVVNALISGGVKRIVVDMINLNYIDSTGIGIIINATKKLRNEEGRIALVNINQTIQQIFNLVNLSSFIPIFKSVKEAADTIRV